MTDYEPLLRRAIANAPDQDKLTRQQIYGDARQAAARVLRQANPPYTEQQIATELTALAAAADRIEREFAAAKASAAASRQRARSAAAPPTPEEFQPGDDAPALAPRRRADPLMITLAALLLTVAVAGAGGWYWLTRTTAPPRREAQPPAPPAAASPQPQAPAADREARAPETAPAAPAPSTPPPAAPRETVPYVFQRQPVFYRTTYPVGTIVVSRSQRFLYWVRPNQVAIRYGIGIGPECLGTAGLFRIHTKVERPPPTAERLLYFGENLKLQGTEDLASVGRNTLVGCFQLANPDTFELYDRIPLQEAIVVLE